MKWRTIVSACVYATVLALMLSTLASAQGDVYLPMVSATGQADQDAVPVAAAAGNWYRYRDGIGYAGAGYSSAGECVNTDLGVEVLDEWVRESPAGVTKGSYLSFWYAEYDWCAGTYRYLSGEKELAKADFVLKPGLNSARVDTELEGCSTDQDGNEMCVPVEIDLAWKGKGPFERARSSSFWGMPGCRTVSRMRATGREAEVSGSVLIEGTDYVPGMDINGYLAKGVSGYFRMQCPAGR